MTQKIVEVPDYPRLSSLCAGAIFDCIAAKPDAVICLATGHSPRGAYREFAQRATAARLDLSQVTFVKLDEWLGPRMDDSVTSEEFLQREILRPLNIRPAQYISFQSDPTDPQAECQRIAAQIAARGPIDLMTLGVGENGHIGLNEPGENLQAGAHIATLAETTRATLPMPLDHGLSVGVGDIFAARQVVLLVSGAKKARALEAFESGVISTRWPVTLLHLHANLLCLIERSLFPTRN